MNNDNGRARVTLGPIGDAVLSTDTNWRVSSINPIAEKLTGWTSADAVGQHVSEVFQVLDGVSRERLGPQMELAIEKGRTIISPPMCVLVRRDMQELHIEHSAAPIHDRSGKPAGMVVVFHDVRGARALTPAQRHDRQGAAPIVDLDHFNHIKCHSDTVTRQGGDEFVVLPSEIKNGEDAAAIAEKIQLALMEPCVDSRYLHVSASLGVSLYPDDGEGTSALLQHADPAMHHVKEKGRNDSQFFEEDMNVRTAERQTITEELRHALARGEFFLVYQPTINLVSGTVTGFEALIRWRHPARGILNPAAFIPIAEACGLIIPIGEWALGEACAQAQRWLAADLKFETMAVNISAVEFRSDRFFEGVRRIWRTTGLDPSYLTLELTETAVMRDLEATRVVLQALSTMGVRIAVDDFGPGDSNLSDLKRFPVNTLKLDRSFIHDLPNNADCSATLGSVIRTAHGLHLQVVAEGVETLQQMKFLQAHNCAEAQGYYFSRPIDPDDCRSLLQLTKQRWSRQFRPPARSETPRS